MRKPPFVYFFANQTHDILWSTIKDGRSSRCSHSRELREEVHGRLSRICHRRRWQAQGCKKEQENRRWQKGNWCQEDRCQAQGRKEGRQEVSNHFMPSFALTAISIIGGSGHGHLAFASSDCVAYFCLRISFHVDGDSLYENAKAISP